MFTVVVATCRTKSNIRRVVKCWKASIKARTTGCKEDSVVGYQCCKEGSKACTMGSRVVICCKTECKDMYRVVQNSNAFTTISGARHLRRLSGARLC